MERKKEKACVWAPHAVCTNVILFLYFYSLFPFPAMTSNSSQFPHKCKNSPLPETLLETHVAKNNWYQRNRLNRKVSFERALLWKLQSLIPDEAASKKSPLKLASKAKTQRTFFLLQDGRRKISLKHEGGKEMGHFLLPLPSLTLSVYIFKNVDIMTTRLPLNSINPTKVFYETIFNDDR